MTAPGTQEIVDAFTAKVTERLDESKLDGVVRMDNTHTVVIVPVRDKGPIYAQLQGGIDDEGIERVVRQLRSVPSLKGLVKET